MVHAVQKAVKEFRASQRNVNFFGHNTTYILTRLPLDNNKVKRFYNINYFSSKTSPIYIYELLLYHMGNDDIPKIMDILMNKKEKINVNRKLTNGNTLYTLMIIKYYLYKDVRYKPAIEYIDQNYKVTEVNNVLGVNYKDYIKYPTELIY